MGIRNIKYLTFSIIMLLTSFIYGQELPLDYNTNIEIQNGAYIKDVNNLFGSYLGRWQGTWDNKIFIIKIEKITQRLHSFPNGDYYADELIAKYEIKNAITNAIIESTMDTPIVEQAKIYSLSYPKNNYFYFGYLDSDRCSNTGKILLMGNPSSNQLSYYYFYDEFWQEENCPYEKQEDIPIPLPTIFNLALTRVN